MLAKGQLEFLYFEGQGVAINGTLDNAAAVDVTTTYGPEDFPQGAVQIPITGHGYQVGDDFKKFNSIYISGSTNYNGVKKIIAVAANTVTIHAKYVAETFAGTEIYQPAMTFDEPWEFVGFKVHLNTASATAENFVLNIDAWRGSAFDWNLFTQDFNTVKDYIKTYDEPSIPLNARDAVIATWANTNNRNWGIELIGRRFS